MELLKVERFCSPGKGNGLRATRALLPGETVYTSLPLAACVLANRHAAHVCHTCFYRRASLRRCSQCKAAWYCDVTCQKGAWPEHRGECRSLCRLRPRVPADSVRLAAKIISRLLSPSQLPKEEELYSLEEHESHLGEMSEEKRQGLSQLAAMLQVYLQDYLPEEAWTSGLDALNIHPLSLLAKMTCNCFTISDGELQEVGVGIYPSMSLLNHDCRPSCVVVFQGSTLHLRTLRHVLPLEELSISYTGSLAPSSERQKLLQDQFHFLCRCQRCATSALDPLMLAGEEATWTPLREALPRLEKLQAEGSWERILEECTSLLSTAGGAGLGGNVYRLRVTDLALDACINLARWESALEYGTQTLLPYRLLYPDPHPAHAVQLLRVGKLQHFLVQLDDAQDTLTQAYDIMKITHGNQHPLTSDLMRKLEECRAEADRA